MAYQQPMQTPMQTQQSRNGLVWVQGENAAKSYPVAPNDTVLLMDSEGDRFYLKSVDASGMPLPLRTFVYRELVAQQAARTEQPENQFATKSELEALREDIEGLKTLIPERVGKPKEEEADGKLAI